MALVNQVLFIVLLAFSPLAECRVSISYGILTGVNIRITFLASVLGNLLPVPLLLISFNKSEAWILKKSDDSAIKKYFVRYVESLRRKSKSQLNKYGFWGLMIFVAVPLPGTGAWTTSIIAAVLGMEKNKAFVSIALGVVEAAIIVTVLALSFDLIF